MHDRKRDFGIGHQETTSLMVEQLLQFPIKDKAVVDVGTGTGILSISASKMGAKSVEGIEIDECAYLNAIDNLTLNCVSNIKIHHGDAAKLNCIHNIDLLIANINRNVILNDIDKYIDCLNDDGEIFLRGFYIDDIDCITKISQQLNSRFIESFVKNKWPLIRLSKSS